MATGCAVVLVLRRLFRLFFMLVLPGFGRVDSLSCRDDSTIAEDLSTLFWTTGLRLSEEAFPIPDELFWRVSIAEQCFFFFPILSLALQQEAYHSKVEHQCNTAETSMCIYLFQTTSVLYIVNHVMIQFVFNPGVGIKYFGLSRSTVSI